MASTENIYKGVVKLPSKADYDELVLNGSITIGGKTIIYSPKDTTYVVPEDEDLLNILKFEVYWDEQV